MIYSMFIQYGGTHFYDYHVAFARKAEQYLYVMGTKLDWASRDSSLYMQTFAGLKSATCDLCSSASHNSKFCPMSISSNRSQSSRVSSNAQPRPGQPDNNLKLINSLGPVYFTTGKKYAITLTLQQGVLSHI